MTSGTINSNNNYAIEFYSGKTNMTGGSITGVYGIYNSNTSTSKTLTLGTNDNSTPNTTSPLINVKNTAVSNGTNFTVYFYDGKVISSSTKVPFSNKASVNVPSGYGIVISSDGTTATLGKLDPITSKVKAGDIINYPTVSNSVSITNSTYYTGITDTQTFSTNGSKIKCVVIRNEKNIVDIVPLTGNYLALFYCSEIKDTKKFDAIANIYNNSTYSQNSYYIGSKSRTDYTTEEDIEAIYNVYSKNTSTYSSLYPDATVNYFINGGDNPSPISISKIGSANYKGFLTCEVYEYPSWGEIGFKVAVSDGTTNNGVLGSDDNGYGQNYATKARIMPIIRLKPTINITGGSGTTSSPYDLGT